MQVQVSSSQYCPNSSTGISRLSSDRRSFDHSSNHSVDRSSKYLSDHSHRNGPRSSYTQRRTYSSNPTAADIISEHQNEFLTKVTNAVKIDPQQSFTPDCICCLALNLKDEL